MNKGFTLVEVVVSTGIVLMLGLVVMQVYWLIVSQTTHYREQSVVVSLADQYMEIARNLPYSQVGTLSGNPHGNLADSVNPITATVNGTSYQIYYVVNYIDDPADGTILAGTDAAPNDYKQVKLYIKNTRTNYTNNFLTSIVPQGLEGLASGGALSIKVFNAVGQPVSGASIRIQNSVLNPSIDLTRDSDANGNWVEVGLPNSSNSYHITVTKNGYSSDQTYAISQSNQSPTKPDATISNGQITQVSFSIDLLSNLTFSVQNQVCAPFSSVGMGITGSKLIGTPSVLKFSNNYSSDAGGLVSLPNVEWDTYTPTLSGNTYMIYGTSPAEQFTILPNTNASFTLILGPKTTNSLLVTVKDNSTSSSTIEGANVTLTASNPSTNISEITPVQSSCFTPGQVMFSNLGAGSNYQVAVSAAGYQTQTITGINISGYNTLQVLMSQ